jgi:hypothetical protein
MIKKIKTIIAALSLVFAMAAPMAAATVSTATAEDCTGIENCLDVGAAKTDDNGETNPEGRVNTIIKTVINIFSLVVGVIAVIMIIIGGLKYITSGGDSGNVTGAKNTILYAIIGLVIVALSQIIVRFVLAKVTGDGS